MHESHSVEEHVSHVGKGSLRQFQRKEHQVYLVILKDKMTKQTRRKAQRAEMGLGIKLKMREKIYFQSILLSTRN